MEEEPTQAKKPKLEEVICLDSSGGSTPPAPGAVTATDEVICLDSPCTPTRRSVAEVDLWGDAACAYSSTPVKRSGEEQPPRPERDEGGEPEDLPLDYFGLDEASMGEFVS